MEMFTVDTRRFLDLLTVLKITAAAKPDDAGYHSIALAPALGLDPDSDRQTEAPLLAGYSSTGGVVGHSFCATQGAHFESPVVIGLPYVDVILPMWRNVLKGKKKDDDHALTLRIDRTAQTLDIRVYEASTSGEDTARGESSDLHQKVPLDPADSVPIESLATVIESKGRAEVTDADGQTLPAGALTMLSAEHLALLAKVGKAVKSEIRTYRLGHPAGTLTIAAGDRWRGAVAAAQYSAADDPNTPTVEPAVLQLNGTAAPALAS